MSSPFHTRTSARCGNPCWLLRTAYQQRRMEADVYVAGRSRDEVPTTSAG